ncbi:Sulfate adenylyltransferase subunit 2 [Fusarium agapanthi]|uniref:Sulfate adenylyltransferase subunit 2 n=1 Tax=Fusarium agapanthi TaxID=1803897 RepID=A0A9P5AWN0_9HYPO|nr:Sulfate adenylyltransferase subunit 2 [Fusarium agapanthi]
MASAAEKESRDQELQALNLQKFYDLYRTARAHHERFINHRQEHEKPVNLLPLDKLEIKLDKIEKTIKIQREVRHKPNWEPNAIQFFFLLNLPLHELSGLWSSTKWNRNAVEHLDNVGPLTSYFLQKAKYVSIKRSRDGSDEDIFTRIQTINAELNKFDAKSVGRDTAEKKQGIDNDGGRCIVTGVANPEVCHIIPFAFNNSDRNTQKSALLTKTIHAMINLEVDTETMDAVDLLSKEKRSSDKQWNMICLSPSLHTWWGYAYLGFKWLGSTPTTNNPEIHEIKLQFHWMPRNIKRIPTASFHPKDLKSLDQEIKHCYGSEPYLCRKPNCQACDGTKDIAAHNVTSGRPIRTGDIFTIRRKKDDILRCRAMFDIQWAIITSAAISGAALVPDELGDFSFPPGDYSFSYEDIKDNVEGDEETRSRVQSWVNQNSPEPEQEL